MGRAERVCALTTSPNGIATGGWPGQIAPLDRQLRAWLSHARVGTVADDVAPAWTLTDERWGGYQTGNLALARHAVACGNLFAVTTLHEPAVMAVVSLL